MTVTLEKLAQAELQDRQLRKAETAGDFVGARFSNLLTRAARRARRLRVPVHISEEEIRKLEVETGRVAAAAYVQEAHRMKKQRPTLELSFFKQQRKVAQQLELDLGDLQNTFTTITGRPLRRSISKLQDRINATIRNIVKQNLSERDATELLAIALEKMGLTTKTPSVVKTWIRTGASFAANAARWDISQRNDDAWGYTYLTMRDDLVRPEHEELEGYTRKKDDPIWLELWPPNGWNCRCQIVVLYEPERQSRKNDSLVDNVDDDFRFNAGVDFLSGKGGPAYAFSQPLTQRIGLTLADCGAGSAGGKGFTKGNTCARGGYPLADEKVSGLVVKEGSVPNTDAIAASLDDYEILEGIREVPISDFELTGRHYAKWGNDKIEELQKQIEKSREISPLIVVEDEEGPYILEGATRIDALYRMKVKSFPALVVKASK